MCTINTNAGKPAKVIVDYGDEDNEKLYDLPPQDLTDHEAFIPRTKLLFESAM